MLIHMIAYNQLSATLCGNYNLQYGDRFNLPNEEVTCKDCLEKIWIRKYAIYTAPRLKISTMPGWAIDWADSYLGKRWRKMFQFWAWFIDDEADTSDVSDITLCLGKDGKMMIVLYRSDAESMYESRRALADGR